MGTTAEKLYRILDSKRAIKEALEAKGVVITDETTFAEYADLINEIVQGAISDADALTFIMDVAEGKRKIAKAVRNKYEGTKGEASEVTEYSTFDELSNKISEIPIEVKSGNASFQNEFQKDENTLIKLPFFDVYNEALKAMKEFAGYDFNGCCAFELDKWSYDNDHKVTLSGADAYYTSDGTFIDKDFYIKENGSVIDRLELDGENSALYQFKDQDKDNTNRFVVFFFSAERYTVPKCLPATSCLNLWCVKGTPLMNFNGDFTSLNFINVYDGELDVNDVNDFKFATISYNQKVRLSHIKEIKNGSNIFYGNTALREVTLPNLTTISGSGYILTPSASYKGLRLVMPNLKKMNMGIIAGSTCYFDELNLDNLEEFTNTAGYVLLARVDIPELFLPKFHKGINIYSSGSNIPTIHLGNGMRDGVAGDIKLAYNTQTTLTTLTVAEGFKANLNLTGCNGLERDVLLGIINNLADLTGTEYEDKLQLTLGSTLYNKLTADDIKIGTDKGWKVTG